MVELFDDEATPLLDELAGDKGLREFVSLFFALDIVGLHRKRNDLNKKERIFILVMQEKYKNMFANLEIDFDIDTVWNNS